MKATYLHLDIETLKEEERATEPTLISVTAEDIERGCPLNAISCPIARSLSRHLAPNVHARVNSSEVTLKRRENGVQKEIIQAELPENAVRFIRLFDKGEWIDAEPPAFYLPLPDPFKRKDTDR